MFIHLYFISWLSINNWNKVVLNTITIHYILFIVSTFISKNYLNQFLSKFQYLQFYPICSEHLDYRYLTIKSLWHLIFSYFLPFIFIRLKIYQWLHLKSVLLFDWYHLQCNVVPHAILYPYTSIELTAHFEKVHTVYTFNFSTWFLMVNLIQCTLWY